MKPDDFIARIAVYAVADMRLTRIPASVTIAQAILESAWGESSLTRNGNNLFGIKGVGTAGSGMYKTKEFVNGQWVTIDAQFRHYHNLRESIADHSALLLNGTRDKPDRYLGVVGTDYKNAAYALRAGGYATDPDYPQLLINLIEQYDLYQYDYDVQKGENRLELTNVQQQMLVDTLTSFLNQGLITDASWVEKARKGTLSISELTWLNTIILSRIQK